MDNRPIGIFDSGVGGLTVVRELQKQLPAESLIYIGDTARVPYGGRAPEVLLTFGRELIEFLKSKGVKAIISACGTTSSNGFTILKAENADMPLFDVITPTVAACQTGGVKTVGFIATEATVNSGLFKLLLNESNPEIKVHMRACPLFVPMAEEGYINNPVAKLMADVYLRDWRNRIETLVLGCTHYPLLIGVIKRSLPKTRIIDMADCTVQAVKEYLIDNAMLSESGTARYQLYATGHTAVFEEMVKKVLEGEHQVMRTALN
jgi:glutamate racemase